MALLHLNMLLKFLILEGIERLQFKSQAMLNKNAALHN